MLPPKNEIFPAHSTTDRISRPFLHFLKIEASGGMVLLACALTAFSVANFGWSSMGGADCLAGIGFMMSIFITGLAFIDESLLVSGKIGTLIGSVVSAAFGLGFLFLTLRRAPQVLDKK